MLVELSDTNNHRPILPFHVTPSAALGTGLLCPQAYGLLLRGCLQGARSQAAGGSHRDLLHHIEINIEIGTVFPPGPFDDNFPPLFGQLLDRRQIFLAKLAPRHIASMLVLAAIAPEQFAFASLTRELFGAKPVLHSFPVPYPLFLLPVFS